MRILEEFWYGNIEPMEYDFSCKEYKALQGLTCRNEKKFLVARTDEQKELFDNTQISHESIKLSQIA